MNRDNVIDWLRAIANQAGDYRIFLDGEWKYIDEICQMAWDTIEEEQDDDEVSE